MSRSRYRPDAPSDYSHRFHAGNVGDVWKHCVLVEVLRRLAGKPVTYVESHAGEGRYPLAATGEWTEGIGRLWDLGARATSSGAPGRGETGDDPVSRYVTLCRELSSGDARPEAYAGSPLLARAVLGAGAKLVLHERETAAFARLETELAHEAGVRLLCDDGLAALAGDVRSAETGHPGGSVASPEGSSAATPLAVGSSAAAPLAVGSSAAAPLAVGSSAAAPLAIALVDPTYAQKADWHAVREAFAEAASAAKLSCLILWYPVKSLTRPNALRAELESAGVAATQLELVTTPLEHQRRRLNGSGVILVRPPAGAVSALAAAAAVIGPRCATRSGAWSLRVASWGER